MSLAQVLCFDKNHNYSTLKVNCVNSPFFMVYRFDEEDDGYYLESYDEMHNHILTTDSGYMPFPTPKFSPF